MLKAAADDDPFEPFAIVQLGFAGLLGLTYVLYSLVAVRFVLLQTIDDGTFPLVGLVAC